MSLLHLAKRRFWISTCLRAVCAAAAWSRELCGKFFAVYRCWRTCTSWRRSGTSSCLTTFCTSCGTRRVVGSTASTSTSPLWWTTGSSSTCRRYRTVGSLLRRRTATAPYACRRCRCAQWCVSEDANTRSTGSASSLGLLQTPAALYAATKSSRIWFVIWSSMRVKIL